MATTSVDSPPTQGCAKQIACHPQFVTLDKRPKAPRSTLQGYLQNDTLLLVSRRGSCREISSTVQSPLYPRGHLHGPPARASDSARLRLGLGYRDGDFCLTVRHISVTLVGTVSSCVRSGDRVLRLGLNLSPGSGDRDLRAS
jgi:hypothetical protein